MCVHGLALPMHTEAPCSGVSHGHDCGDLLSCAAVDVSTSNRALEWGVGLMGGSQTSCTGLALGDQHVDSRPAMTPSAQCTGEQLVSSRRLL